MSSDPMGSPIRVARLVMVATPQDAPSPEDGTLIVILDATWTAMPDERRDLVAIRAVVSGVLDRLDPFADTLVRLDDWAERARVMERMTIDEVSWWFRARETAWRWLHERVLWRMAIGALVDEASLVELVVPGDEGALLDVARAIRAAFGTVVRVGAPSAVPTSSCSPGAAAHRGAPGVSARIRWWAGLPARRSRSRALSRRTTMLDRRIESALARPGRVLVLSHIGLRQQVATGAGERAVDPNLGSVIERLADEGSDAIILGLGLDHRTDVDWPSIASDDDLLPASLLQTRWHRAAGAGAIDATPDDAAARRALDTVLAKLDGADDDRLDSDGVDLGPALLEEIRAFASGPMLVGLRQIPRVQRLLGELRPRVVLMTHEGIRTPWVVAARALKIPTFAVQHGMIYADHPGYRHRREPGLVLPDLTFVYGEYERRVLLDHGGYRPVEVEVVGSPRVGLDLLGGLAPEQRAADRSAMRRELDVADGDRLLVVSTVFLPFVRRFYYAHMLERLLGGPVPGIHVVFKLHPGEDDLDPYRTLLDGLATAHGYRPPSMSLVKDVDLYRLLHAADAHLGLTSTVLTDAVVAGTPNLIAAVGASHDVIGYVAAGVARPISDLAALCAAVIDPPVIDPAARRAFLQAHFRDGDAGERIVAALRRVSTPEVRPDSIGGDA